MVQSLDDARRRNQSAHRVPPHNLQAEQSLLGAMLLSRDAIAAAVETCRADDFYKPGHAHVFDAICTLYSQGEPADPLTVADVLTRAGLLEAVGGLPALVSLQADTPATANAGRYARIVEEHALLRRLIGAAGEIAELGYSVPDDVAATLDRAETMVFDIAERRVTDTLKPLKELLEDSLDRLAALFSRDQTLTGVPTGFVDLDERLLGLQPAALVIVGARPAMGKALALDTPIPTPEGWTTMGELAVGDQVLGSDGRPCTVTYATPVQLGRTCYRVELDDGSGLVADADHQWLAYDHAAWKSARERSRSAPIGIRSTLARDQSSRWTLPRVVTTRSMIHEGVTRPDRRPNWYLPLAAPLDLPEADLPVDPYVLGCWLGDGTSTSSEITIGPADADHFRTEFALAGYPLTPRGGLRYATVPVPGQGAWQSYRGPCRVLTRELQAVDLLGGARKRIPPAYLRAAFKQRLALLQGLLDTDGHANRQGGVEVCLADEALCRSVRELVCSLGHKPGPLHRKSIPLGDGRSATAWRFSWTPLDPVFRMERKLHQLQATGRHRSFGVATRRAVRAIHPVASVPVRCITVDSPDHLYLAGESMVPTHNTSFALGIAAHAAMAAKVPTLVFSLEMSHSELTQRLLVSEARVDATRVRSGRLQESDWPKISNAIGRLGEAPLFIDDNPNLTVMDVRAKARRMKSREGGLGLIVIDYLQLMSGRNSAENRQVEVSEISRGLKILARELNVPVLALSQLSRNLEARADKRPMLADLRESGCMPAGTRLQRADTGAEVTLGELVLSQEQPLVWSLDETTWKLVPRRLLKAFPSGVKPAYRLRLASGREVTATANHPFRTIDGWSPLDQLTPGTAVAVPRRLPAPVQPLAAWPEDELVLLAHLLGDGSIGPVGVKYATADPANRAVVEGAAHRLFGITAQAKQEGRTWQLWLPAPYRLTHGRHHPVRNWLEPLGLWGSRSHNKFIPEALLGLADDQLRLFLRHLWATDGSITTGRNRRGRCVRIYYATTSRSLADGVRRALLRLGVQSRLSPSRKEGYRTGWHVIVSGKPDQLRFLTAVGCHGERGERVAECIEILDAVRANPNVDLVPWAVAGRVKEALSRASVSHRDLATGLGERYCGSYLLGSLDRPRRYSRGRLAEIARLTGDDGLAALAASDVSWDEVVEVSPAGTVPTFDATVEGTHNFVADGIIAHNSLEQDADVVMFLYRDEIYNPDSADRGIAEVIVAKHRNGPTGTASLAFLDHYTRFADMARM